MEVSDELGRGVKAGYEYLAPALQQIETVNPEGRLRVLTPSSADEHRLRRAFLYPTLPPRCSDGRRGYPRTRSVPVRSGPSRPPARSSTPR